uniref:jerky protein homolog-like n=1 Tax=Osmia lignaria TaxID=473952 RepID=UPI001479057F|nr:jerky protein homolog-like [Osmia lignaria]
MATRKKYTVLNMQQRLDVLKDLQDTGLTVSEIGKKYGVDAKTIRRIKKNRIQISSFADKTKRERQRRKLIDPVYDELDKCLLAWFIERRTIGDRLTDALLLEKASDLKENLPSCSRFELSRGWLSKFKKRHGIHLVRLYGEKASADKDGATTFINNFKQLMNDDDINLENVYNMDESALV